MTRRERMIKQAEMRKKMKNRSPLYKVAPQEEIDKLLNNPLDKERYASLKYETDTNINTEVDSKEVQELLSELRNSFDKEQLDKLFQETKKDLVQSIIVPFGLGKIVGAYDKAGGNVTTLHNFKQGTVATAEDQKKYNEWQNSKNNKVDRKEHDVIKDKWKKDKYQTMKDGEIVKDGYTGNKLGKKEYGKIKKDTSIDGEHITSVSEIEKDPKNHLFAEGGNTEERIKERAKTSGDEKNLTLIEGGMNSSKGDRDLKEWANSPISKKHANEMGTTNMTNAEYYKLNPELIEKEYKKSKEFIAKEQKKKQLHKQSKELLSTGLNEGAKMGAQQAIGIIIMEFLTSAFTEIKDAYNSSLDGDTLYENIKKRLKRIAVNVMSKWKDVVKGFSEGFISGFISNIITFMINTLITTGKRVVRMIREGFFSLLKAFKLLIFPPENMTRQEAAHEAMKLFFAGGIIVAGVALEEVVEKFIISIPILAPFASIITAVIVGSLTAIAMAIVTYLVDKADLLNVNRHKRNNYISNALDKKIETSLIEAKVIVHNINDLKWV